MEQRVLKFLKGKVRLQSEYRQVLLEIGEKLTKENPKWKINNKEKNYSSTQQNRYIYKLHKEKEFPILTNFLNKLENKRQESLRIQESKYVSNSRIPSFRIPKKTKILKPFIIKRPEIKTSNKLISPDSLKISLKIPLKKLKSYKIQNDELNKKIDSLLSVEKERKKLSKKLFG